MNPEFLLVASLLSILLTLASLLAIIWKAFSYLSTLELRLQNRMIEIQHSLEKKDMEVENIQLQIESGVNGLKERLNHVAGRLKEQSDKHERRITDIERFISKTGFTPRDY